MLRRTKPNIIDIILLIGLSVFFVILFFNRNNLSVPNPDIFQYIHEGSYYTKLRLPPSIQPGPVLPLLITLLTKTVKYFSIYPEITSAHLINIFSATATIFFVYLIVKKYSQTKAIIVSVLLSTNIFFFANAIDVSTEVLCGLEISLIFFFYQKKMSRLFYLTSALAFLTRYESIVIIFSIILIDLFSKNKNIKYRSIFILLIPLIIWLLILNQYSPGSSIIDNIYIQEIFFAKGYLHPQPFFEIFITSFGYFGPAYRISRHFSLETTKAAFSAIIICLAIINIFHKKTSSEIKAINLMLISQIIVLSIFPNFSQRYLHPIYWILFFIIINIKKIGYFLAFLIFISNIYNITNQDVDKRNNELKEYRIISSWINSQQTKDNTAVITYSPCIIKYIISNYG